MFRPFWGPDSLGKNYLSGWPNRRERSGLKAIWLHGWFCQALRSGSLENFPILSKGAKTLSQKKKKTAPNQSKQIYTYIYICVYIYTCIICILIYFLDINTTYNIYIYIYALICKKIPMMELPPTSQGRKKKKKTDRPRCWCFYVARWCHEHRVEAFQLPWRPGRSMAPSRWRSSRWRSPGVGVAQKWRCC